MKILKLILLTPFWLVSISKTRKTFAEFKSGLIKHKCNFDYNKPIFLDNYVYFKCSHFGCNIVIDKD